MPHVAPYGSWKSPITTDLIVAAVVRLGQIALDGDDVYWIEERPAEAGRNVIVRRTSDGGTADVTPPPFNVRTRVHEYGGGAFAVADGVVYFSNFADQRVYGVGGPDTAPHTRPIIVGGRTPSPQHPPALAHGPAGLDASAGCQPITGAGALRYADLIVDRARDRLVCVREDHNGGEPVNTIAAIALDGSGDQRVLVSGHDFYSSPRLSPDGARLAWLAWDHPNMPWDGSELWVADVAADGGLAGVVKVAGGDDESIFQPEWSPDGVLHFVSDRTGWWNLYRTRDGRIAALCPMAAEFGQPQWVFGASTYGFASPRDIVCVVDDHGRQRLARLDPDTGRLTTIETPYTHIADPRVAGRRVVFRGGSPTESTAIVALDLPGGAHVLRRGSSISIDEGYLSRPRAIEFPTSGGLTAHAFFYPPANRDFAPPPGERPPLLVLSHGGPTGATTSTLNPAVQYWTSRGIAVLDVNYGGSTGYGRAYRKRLEGQWGVVDVDDCVNGARDLAARGEVDPDRLAIRGGSAGGYTTLCALTFRDTFRAGASYFGIGDLERLARDTHKFEARYLDRLVGPYPESRDLYRARSPIHAVDRLSCPVIFFQGLDDKVVPPNQAELMVAALRARRIPVAYVPFPGEQHGFRRAETIKRALDAELYFYSRVFGFALADPVEPVPIDGLP